MKSKLCFFLITGVFSLVGCASYYANPRITENDACTIRVAADVFKNPAEFSNVGMPQGIRDPGAELFIAQIGDQTVNPAVQSVVLSPRRQTIRIRERIWTGASSLSFGINDWESEMRKLEFEPTTGTRVRLVAQISVSKVMRVATWKVWAVTDTGKSVASIPDTAPTWTWESKLRLETFRF